MRKSSRAEVPMERYCFDYPRELFPVQQQSGLKEGYGKLSGWLSDGSLKRSGANMHLRLKRALKYFQDAIMFTIHSLRAFLCKDQTSVSSFVALFYLNIYPAI